MENENNIAHYKTAKTLEEQIEYLNNNKRVQFNRIPKEKAKESLLRYNYINVITPFKHHFAKLDNKREVVKEDNKHIYERDVEFEEYYNYFIEERKKYPIIVKNILDFEIHLKSIVAYHILTKYHIENSEQLKQFLDKLKVCFSILPRSFEKRIVHMNEHINALKQDIDKYADIYCFFDRMALGNILTVFICLDFQTQNKIMNDLMKFEMTFNTEQVQDFIKKVFSLVSIRNCVMHGNSLEILVRFYDHKTHELRKTTDRKRFIKLIQYLSIEKTHE